MADQGAIGVAPGQIVCAAGTRIPNWWTVSLALARAPGQVISMLVKYLPIWKYDPNTTGTLLVGTDSNGILAGIAYNAGIPLQNVWVSVYYRGGSTITPGGGSQLIGRTRTTAAGAWSLQLFESGKAFYTVVVEVPDTLSALGYNSLVFDNVVPA